MVPLGQAPTDTSRGSSRTHYGGLGPTSSDGRGPEASDDLISEASDGHFTTASVGLIPAAAVGFIATSSDGLNPEASGGLLPEASEGPILMTYGAPTPASYSGVLRRRTHFGALRRCPTTDSVQCREPDSSRRPTTDSPFGGGTTDTFRKFPTKSFVGPLRRNHSGGPRPTTDTFRKFSTP
jgi:hypothetical protein